MNMLSLIDVRCGATEPEPHMEMSVPLSDVHQDMFELLTFAGERGGARADRPKLETYCLLFIVISIIIIKIFV